jgi:hypothetical protein
MPSLAEILLEGGRLKSDALLRQAQITADAQRNKGLLWGAALSNAGQTIGQGIQHAQDLKAEEPLRQAQLTEAQTRNQIGQAQLGQMGDEKAAAAQRGQQNQILLNSWEQDDSGNWRLNIDKAHQAMQQAGLPFDPAELKPHLESLDSLNKQAHEAQTAYMNKAIDIVHASGDSLDALGQAVHGAVLNRYLRDDEATAIIKRAQADPSKIPQMLDQLQGKESKVIQLAPGATAIRENQLGPTPYTAPAAPVKPPAPPNVGSLEDFTTRKYGPNPTPQQVLQAKTQFDAAGRPPAPAAEPELPPDPASLNLLSQTGLSLNAFRSLVDPTTLPRDAATRKAAALEAQTWARAHNVDVSTIKSQYKTYNDVLSANISRLNNTKIMENEVLGTIDNLRTVANDKDLGSLKFANVLKVWAGQEVNDDLAQQYALHLGQLRNELTAYYAATQGRTGNNIAVQDKIDAENTIKNGIAAGSLDGLQKAIENSTKKMGTVLQGSVDRTQKSVWDLFGVGGNFKGKQPNTTQAPAKVGDTHVGSIGGQSVTFTRIADGWQAPDGTVYDDQFVRIR